MCMSFALLLCVTAVLSGSDKMHPHVLITTSLGSIEVELDAKHAPNTTANFLRYVDEGHYVGGRFHRTVTMQNQPDKKVKIEVIQGGVGEKFADKDFPPIKLERTNKTHIHHKDGTISMARDGADTATSDFFICINNQPSLDYGGKRNPDGQGFAAFGHVVKGMDIVRKIQMEPSDKDQHLTPPIEIVDIRRVP